jgi:molybdopterin-containing oxidoreductase family iron-sulfur binding subunit
MSAHDHGRQDPLDLPGLRGRLSGVRGRTYWRSLEELAETPAFLDLLHREFPAQASVLEDPEGRRNFLRIMGASLALAGVTACTRQPEEKIVPYVRAPEDLIPGRPLFFATAVLDGGYAKGVLVESHMGRPTKVEGNSDHPGSLGATDSFGQASVLDLYDPDRSQILTHLGEIRAWSVFLAAMKPLVEAQRARKGAGIRVLTGTITSPTLGAQLQELLSEFPSAKWHQWEPSGLDNARAGALQAFGEPVETVYRFEKAEVILSLEADFVQGGAASLRLIREFAANRKLQGDRRTMNRLYVVEGTRSLTGSLADHRLALRPSEVEAFARALARRLGAPVDGGMSGHPWVEPLARDLEAHRGAGVVLAGEGQPPAVHVLAHAMNERLGNVGTTVVHTEPVEVRPVDQLGSLRELAADMDQGAVSLLLVLGVNPVYTGPADLDLAAKMDKVPLRIHLGLHQDETADRCHWHIPEAHPLEAWSDARAFDGTATIMQPLIAPLYDSARSAHEVLAAFSAHPERSGYELVREHWRSRMGAGDFESQWRKAVHDGVVPGTAAREKAVRVKTPPLAGARPAAGGTELELVFRADPTVGDGRFANNGWLQELPKPLTKLTWGNAALMSPRTAQGLGVAVGTSFTDANGTAGENTGTPTDVVELRYKGHTLRAPAWIVPGHPDGSVTLHLGYGRRRTGRVGSGTGVDAYALRTSDALWFGSGLVVVKTGERTTLACTQDHWSMESRDLVRAADLDEYHQHPGYARERPGAEDPPRDLSLYPSHRYDGHAWGMTIDLNSCVGCNACVVACVAENNIPVVGKEQVGRGREMHWLRIDRYYAGTPDEPETFHQPVLCMQCENAPCEVVCPVEATAHSDEGLNDMVYNRCIGTRYCSNNCPYKVRRFNFFLYQDWTTPTLKMARNPDVTVRSRGVMEKCTYCVQRINQSRIDAKNEGREIRDGDITTACQAACPAEAIVFGDVNDRNSRVSRLKSEPRNYGLLTDLNTRPRTTYLAAVRNPNPEMSRSEG